MIILNPMGSSNGAHIKVNNVYDYDVTYAFASYLAAYLRLRSEPCILTRYTSEALVGIAYNSFIINNAPSIILNIKCLSDVNTGPRGYTVECDKYSAFAATIASEMHKAELEPVYPLGYKITNSKTSAKYTEITVGLGYLTNSIDFSKLCDNAFLDSLSKHIIDASYGPPTKVMQPNDSVYVPDPYMYNSSVWLEDTANKVSGDKGGIVDSTITNIPVRVLRLSTPKAARSKPYAFSTPVNVDGAVNSEVDYTVIVSYRIENTGGSGCVCIGNTKKDISYMDAAWHRLSFNYSYTKGDRLLLGANSNSSIVFTAAWVTNAGVLDSVDDPLKIYSVYPPGYRPITSIDPTSVKNSIANVVTNASSLIGRAQDNCIPTTASSVSGPLGILDQLSISAKPFVDGIKGIMTQITGVLKDPSNKPLGMPDIKVPPVPNLSDFLSKPTIPKLPTPGAPKLPNLPALPPFPSIPIPKLPGMPEAQGLIKNNQLAILDPNVIKPQFTALENTVVSLTRADKRGDMLNVVNTLKGVAQASDHLTTSYESKLKAAKAKAEEIKVRTELKGEAMSKT